MENKGLIIHCPTKKEWDSVVKTIKANNPNHEIGDFNHWNSHKEESCIFMESNNPKRISYGDRPYFEENYSNTKIITAKRFLRAGSIDVRETSNEIKERLIDRLRVEIGNCKELIEEAEKVSQKVLEEQNARIREFRIQLNALKGK